MTATILAAAALGTAMPAVSQIAVQNQGFVPFTDPPISYRGPVDDPVARLQRRIDAGQVTLAFTPAHGYLESALEQLRVPVRSQTLVATKTSFQFRYISPTTPRALYFNDDVYVGWVQGGKALEFVSFDPRQGAIFYILAQTPGASPRFERAELDCTQCHVARDTQGVPGVFLRSIFSSPRGTQLPKSTSFLTGHESPIAERWGGWYVTGTHGRLRHMGNVFALDRSRPEEIDREAGANVTDLSTRLDVSPYLTPHSDIVAHLVQAHQTQMHNLITAANYQTRLALHGQAGRESGGIAAAARAVIEEHAEAVVRYLLFAGEAPLGDVVRGTSGFAESFAALGPRDARGRSLREFDLQRRLFRYPLSYLVYSEAFDALPEPAGAYIDRRLREVLSGQDQSPAFAHIDAPTRRAIVEILLATKPGLPAEWKALAARVRPGAGGAGETATASPARVTFKGHPS